MSTPYPFEIVLAQLPETKELRELYETDGITPRQIARRAAEGLGVSRPFVSTVINIRLAVRTACPGSYN